MRWRRGREFGQAPHLFGARVEGAREDVDGRARSSWRRASRGIPRITKISVVDRSPKRASGRCARYTCIALLGIL